MYKVGKCRVREILAAKRMTQKDLVSKTGIHKQHISAYINNRRKMNLSTAKTIASALDCSIDELYEWYYVE